MGRLSDKILGKLKREAESLSDSFPPRKPLSSPPRSKLDLAVQRRVSAHRRKRTNILLAIFLPLGFIVLILLFWPVYTATGVRTSPARIIVGTVVSGRPLPWYFSNQSQIHLVFTGLDKDPPHRSDTVMVCNLDLRTLQTRVLSVPRDLRVELPDGSWDKLAHAYVYGYQRAGDGAQWVQEAVEGELQMEIPYFVTINFDGFVKLVEALGGVDITVEKRLRYVDHAQNLVIDIPEGTQHMDGEMLLKYVRFRHDETGDLGRMQRQQKAIFAILDGLKRRGMYQRLPTVIPALRETFQTNLTLDQITALARQVPRIQDDFIQTMTVPSESTMIDGVSYQRTTSEWLRESIQFLEDLTPHVETKDAAEESNHNEQADDS